MEIDVVSAFDSVLVNDIQQPVKQKQTIGDIFNKRFETVFKHLSINKIDQLEPFKDTGFFKLLTKDGVELNVPDGPTGYNKHNQEYMSKFGNKFRYDYIREFNTNFKIREFVKEKHQPITHKCLDLTQEIIKDKLDIFVQEYYKKYLPLNIFKTSYESEAWNETLFVFLHKKHLVYIQFNVPNTSYTSNDHYNDFEITFSIYFAKFVDRFDFIKNLSIPRNLIWHRIFDHNIYTLNLEAIKSFAFEPEITNKIFKHTQNTKSSTDDINNIIISSSGQSASPKSASPKSASPKSASPKSAQLSVEALSKELSEMTVEKLKTEAKAIRLRKYSGMNKKELVEKLATNPLFQTSLRSRDLTGAKTKHSK
jgi:hypothetical protein